MSTFSLIILSLALAMDATAIAISNGMACNASGKLKQGLCTALAFAFAQGLMPVLGYILGHTVGDYIAAFDHWLAFLILGFLGIKMIIDCWRNRNQQDEICLILSPRLLITQAIATSLDALAVGISLAVMQVSIIESASIIAAITFGCAAIGFYFGHLGRSLFKKWALAFGGIILIIIGLRILIEGLLT